jgi:hypothetical protein
VRDPGGSRHESSIENQNTPGAYSSSNILQHLLVRNTDGVDGAARTVWRQMVLRFCESGLVAAEEDELLCAGAGEGGGSFAADAASISVVSVSFLMFLGLNLELTMTAYRAS